MLRDLAVAPLAGAWIEILNTVLLCVSQQVAPLAGAWIEMLSPYESAIAFAWSLPSRERGLKLFTEEDIIIF